MRAVQLRGGLGFAAEPLLKRGVVRVVSGRGFGGYDAVGHRVVRPPYLAHQFSASVDQAICLRSASTAFVAASHRRM